MTPSARVAFSNGCSQKHLNEGCRNIAMETFSNYASASSSESEELLQIELLLQGGFTFKLNVRPDDPLLAQVLGAFSLDGPDRARKIFKIDINQDTSSIIFRASELVGIRTTPPVEFLPTSGLSLKTATAPTIEHAVWSRFEDFLVPDVTKRLHSIVTSLRTHFRETASSSERILRYAGDQLAEFEVAKIELQRVLHERMPEILDCFGLDLYAYEFNCEVCAYSNGGYTMPKLGQHPICQGRRIIEFLYFIHADDLELGGACTRLYDVVTEGEVRKMGNLAVELPAQRNAILIFPSDFYFEVTPVGLTTGRAQEVLYVLQGCLSTAP
jgi:hypothetical protein